MVNFENKERYGIGDLRKLVSLLRGPGGCPWDAEQTHESLRRNFLEEAYEAVEAIEEGNAAHLCEELGDVLMQVMFHSDIEADEGRFSLDDVADMAVKKLISRHPHVFGNVAVSGSEEVISNWDKLKRTEKNHETVADSLDGVARSLPSLWRAEKIQKKSSQSRLRLAGCRRRDLKAPGGTGRVGCRNKVRREYRGRAGRSAVFRRQRRSLSGHGPGGGAPRDL